MIGGLNPYSAYKDSGVPWLGDVPAHWEVRLKALGPDVANQTSNGMVRIYLALGNVESLSVRQLVRVRA